MTKRTKRLTTTLIAMMIFGIVFAVPMATVVPAYEGPTYIDIVNNEGAHFEAFAVLVHASYPVASGYVDIRSLSEGNTFTAAGQNGDGDFLIDWVAPANTVVYYVFVKTATGGNLYVYKAGATSGDGLVCPGGHQVSHVSYYYGPAPTPTVPESTPTEPVATPTDPVATPTEPVATPTEPVATPTTPVATPTTPVATPTEPVATPTEPVATPTTPVATPTTPVTTPTTPVTTPTTVPTITIPETTIPQTTITGYATITEPPIPKTGGPDSNLLYLLGSALVAGGLVLKRRKNHN